MTLVLAGFGVLQVQAGVRRWVRSQLGLGCLWSRLASRWFWSLLGPAPPQYSAVPSPHLPSQPSRDLQTRLRATTGPEQAQPPHQEPIPHQHPPCPGSGGRAGTGAGTGTGTITATQPGTPQRATHPERAGAEQSRPAPPQAEQRRAHGRATGRGQPGVPRPPRRPGKPRQPPCHSCVGGEENVGVNGCRRCRRVVGRCARRRRCRANRRCRGSATRRRRRRHRGTSTPSARWRR